LTEGVVLFCFLITSPYGVSSPSTGSDGAVEEKHTMSFDNHSLGQVEAGCFRLLLPVTVAGTCRRLTAIAMQVAQPPEVQEVHRTVFLGGEAYAYQYLWYRGA
jgi:hypothetical protein